MSTFFLHNCVPDSSPEEIQEAFRKAFSGLQILETKLNGDDEILVATLPEPNLQQFGNTYLPTLTYTEDKDFQTYIYSKLSRYPAETEMINDIQTSDKTEEDKERSIEEELINSLNYELLGKDAMYIALAKKADWISFSLPLHAELKTNILQLSHRDTKAILSVENYYGENNSFAHNLLIERKESRLSRYEQLLTIILKGWNIVPHNDFTTTFATLSAETQQGVLDLIKSARNEDMLLPCRPDGKRLKKCDVANNKYVYELRTQNYDGMRIFLDQEGASLFLIDIGFKSDYPSKNAQTKALKKAAAKALSLKAKHNSM